ncbi:right-handed parallel beta-helix repeat-containing protein [Undibacterium sp. Jales W-56]|uniref:right-handed parallel beta-helix repeat-containing protein n=1 Tax=Undibacterium sp. Jales W-56 TaxID=2897325 RepID=UPI0021CF0D39|nr:right-handed parallel beta-helix repeat-containing protein [Undibacterium sp. Jales W-56]MCU6432538.1 right-handed parallel beta-helix repeat-containing protein [Undibacterium sp. Jales W-56]
MRSKIRSYLRYVIALVVLTMLVGGAVIYYLQKSGVTPRALSPYVERRTSDHNPLIIKTGEWVGKALMLLDRGASKPHQNSPTIIGAQTSPRDQRHAARHEADRSVDNRSDILVTSSAQLVAALSKANAGDLITIMPGTYHVVGTPLIANRPGTAGNRITVRAIQAGTVFLEFNLGEGFQVSAPYWTFENLSIRGVCQHHENCEHAFHVTGGANHFTASNNTIRDFNAHFKINGSDGRMPDFGLIEGNTLSNTSARKTSAPVTLIDLVAASNWVIRRNLITDFIKDQGDRISYGAFAKGAGSGNKFEQNIVLCEHLLRGAAGQRVGLSLGGGGTGKDYCRDRRCITEQDKSIVQANLIASCSDDGIYLNRAAASVILHNTVIDTAGVTIRFPESSADVEGNLVDGPIRSRDDGLLRSKDNRETPIALLYLGYHPLRSLFLQAEAANFMSKDKLPHRSVTLADLPDLCDSTRPPTPSYGAFEDFSTCLLARPGTTQSAPPIPYK